MIQKNIFTLSFDTDKMKTQEFRQLIIMYGNLAIYACCF